jgi:hypothetical protein
MYAGCGPNLGFGKGLLLTPLVLLWPTVACRALQGVGEPTFGNSDFSHCGWTLSDRNRFGGRLDTKSYMQVGQ